MSRSSTIHCDSCGAELWTEPEYLRILNVEFDLCNLCQRRLVAWVRDVDESEVLSDGKLARECR